MYPDASDPPEDLERGPAQAFQSEDAEHVTPPTPVLITPFASGPAAAYQREDDELVWPID